MLVFLWWAGAGLSALVNIFHELWFEDIVVVDKYQSQITDKLQEKWIKVVIGDGVYDFQKEDIIFYSDAVINSQDFQKVQNNIKFTYFQFLWEISKWFQTIAVAGTHGKTSTTAMILTVAKNIWFKDLWLGIVGGFVPDLNNNNFYVNQNRKEDIKKIFEKLLTAKWNRPVELFKEMYFIVEADEFNKHFLLLDPSISLITKVDHDHKDVYPTLENYLATFKEFINKTKKEVFTNDEELKWNLMRYSDEVWWNIQINLVKQNNNIKFKYMFGEHMKKNASLVVKLFEILGFKEQKVIEILNNFKWIWRRQEYLGDLEIDGDNGDKIKWKDDKISYEIIWTAMKIHKEFWWSLQEKLYQKALKKILKEKGFDVEEEKNIKIILDWVKLTYGRIDLIVNNKIIIELKSTNEITSDNYKQTRKYLKFGNYNYWLILNFWKDKLDFRRIEKNISKISSNLQSSIYTDYAHHPTEIEATVDAFKQNFPEKKIIWVFQPHQLFRFVSYEKDFISSLSKFDKIYIYDIYSVREDKLIKQLIKEKNLDVKNNQEAIQQIWTQIAQKLNWKYIDNFDKLIENLTQENWIVVLMTAWDLDYKIRNYLT